MSLAIPARAQIMSLEVFVFHMTAALSKQIHHTAQVLGNYDSTAMDTDSPSYRRSLMATGYGYRGCSTDCEEKSLSGTDRLRGKRGFEECNMNAPVPSAKPRHYKYDVYPGSTYGKAGVAGALHTSHQLYSPQLSAAEKAVLTIQHLTRGPSRQLEAPGRGSILAALDASNGRVLLAGRELLVRAQSNIANSSSLTPLEVCAGPVLLSMTF